MHAYRTHTCTALRASDVGQQVRLSGWVHRKRDHGNLLFIDLRDHYGLTQIVIDSDSPAFAALERLRVESVVTVTGTVVARSAETVNANLPTGEIEVRAGEVIVQSAADELPMPVAGEQEYPEDIRLRYRFLDLRRERLHRNIMLRSQVIASLAQADGRAGLHRVPDPDPDRIVARRRARLSGAQPRASRQVLRAAAGAADVQAAADGRRLRPLFPDRAVLPRRRRARRPQPGRILPARPRNELRDAGRRVRRDGTGARRRVRGIRQRQGRDRRRIPAHSVSRVHAEIRLGQARSAQPAGDHAMSPITSRDRALACSTRSWVRAARSARSPHPAQAR